jgi:enolase-phosphatase E1
VTAPGPSAVVVDIEGTTTPVAFVYDVLFPYARERVSTLLARAEEDHAVRDDVALLAREHGADVRAGEQPPPWSKGDDSLAAAAAYVHWLMDRDRKSTALKSLQGRIWEEGFRAGHLRSEVYDDVPPAFRRWHDRGQGPWIFSSGSVLAQRLLFGHTRQGDLTPLIAGYFDTTTGPKKDAVTYPRIAKAVGAAAPSILFVSDVTAELDAARQAGFRTALCVRGDEPADTGGHPVIRSFDPLD